MQKRSKFRQSFCEFELSLIKAGKARDLVDMDLKVGVRLTRVL